MLMNSSKCFVVDWKAEGLSGLGDWSGMPKMGTFYCVGRRLAVDCKIWIIAGIEEVVMP